MHATQNRACSHVQFTFDKSYACMYVCKYIGDDDDGGKRR